MRRVALLCILAIVVVASFVPGPATDDGYDRTMVHAGNASYDVRIADTQETRSIGLSNTTGLDDQEGMLFVHENVGERSYVMRDMAFPIDIVFIDANGTVTGVDSAASTRDDHVEGVGRYVLEIAHGETDRIGLQPGDEVEIDGMTRA